MYVNTILMKRHIISEYACSVSRSRRVWTQTKKKKPLFLHVVAQCTKLCRKLSQTKAYFMLFHLFTTKTVSSVSSKHQPPSFSHSGCLHVCSAEENSKNVFVFCCCCCCCCRCRWCLHLYCIHFALQSLANMTSNAFCDSFVHACDVEYIVSVQVQLYTVHCAIRRHSQFIFQKSLCVVKRYLRLW